jgi:hypothetical protein
LDAGESEIGDKHSQRRTEITRNFVEIYAHVNLVQNHTRIKKKYYDTPWVESLLILGKVEVH